MGAFACAALLMATLDAQAACTGVKRPSNRPPALGFVERGNELTREMKFDDAIACYTAAIESVGITP